MAPSAWPRLQAHRGPLLAGIGVALAVALPPALVAQVIDASGDGDLSGAITYPVVTLVLAGMCLGGLTAAARASDRKVLVAAAAALVATALVQGLGIVRRSVAGEDVAWGTVPVVAMLSVGAAAGSAALVTRRAGRTRP